MADDVFEKIDLPSGGWVAFRDPKLLTRSQRKPLRNAQTRLGLAVNVQQVLAGAASAAALSDADVELWDGLMNATAAVLIDSWSFDSPPSVEALAAVEDEADYEAIIEAAMKHRPTLLPDFSPGPREDDYGDERPTGPSDVSVNTSEDSPSTVFPTTSSPLGDS